MLCLIGNFNRAPERRILSYVLFCFKNAEMINVRNQFVYQDDLSPANVLINDPKKYVYQKSGKCGRNPSMSHCQIKTRRRKIQGSILLDAMVGVFVLTIATLSYLSLTVVTHRSQVISKDETKAAQMTARLLEQVQLLKTSDLNVTTLKAMNLVDTTSTGSPYSFTNIPLDQGTMYSPSKALTQGTGTLTVSTLANGSKRVLATINWTSASGKQRSFSSGTIIGSYK
jgi:Tfp pilus assembly protein PilV